MNPNADYLGMINLLRSLREKALISEEEAKKIAARLVLKSGPDWLEAFDEELFSELVESIIVVDNESLRFRLINGLEVTEAIERTKR